MPTPDRLMEAPSLPLFPLGFSSAGREDMPWAALSPGDRNCTPRISDWLTPKPPSPPPLCLYSGGDFLPMPQPSLPLPGGSILLPP